MMFTRFGKITFPITLIAYYILWRENPNIALGVFLMQVCHCIGDHLE